MLSTLMENARVFVMKGQCSFSPNQGGDLHYDEMPVRGLQEVGVPLHLDLHLVLHPVDLQDVGKHFSFSTDCL